MKRVALGLLLAALTTSAAAADRLVILSPHRKSIQDEFIPAFKDWYHGAYKTDVDVEWLDNGGTSDAVRLLRTKLQKTPGTAGIDVFWGGGSSVFNELDRSHLLAHGALPSIPADDLPASVAGVALMDAAHSWDATALSSFGIFFNRKVVMLENITAPATWEDLAAPGYLGEVSLADPRHSGSAMTMNQIVLQSRGWEKGWELLTRIAGNTRAFTHSSSDPIKAVVSGDVAAAMAIDFYALPQVAEFGAKNLDFVLPQGETVMDPDPVGIVTGAPNLETARRFVTFVLTPAAQKLLILPKGATGGPRLETLARMAVSPAAYAETEGRRVAEINPFKQAPMLKLDQAKAAKLERPLADLLGAVEVDTHRELVAAWSAVIKRGLKPDEVQALSRPPVTEAELLALAQKWDDNIVRNETINAWVQAAKTKYQKLASN